MATHEDTRKLDELIEAVEELRRRVAALERGAAPVTANIAASTAGAAAPAEHPDLSTRLLAALGRSLLGIAGAYLLRAITEAGILPQLAGTLLGIAYACGWLLWTRHSKAAHRLIVALQAFTAGSIIAPLLWEATVRFHTLSPNAAAAALAVFVILGQVIGWRRDLSAVAGVTALAGAATGIALIVATLDPVPFAISLAIAAAMVEGGAIRDRSLSLRWIIALGADFCAFLLMYVATLPQGVPEGYAHISRTAAMAIPVGLLAIYLASTNTRSMLRGLSIAWFEIAQLAAISTLAVVTALRLGHSIGVLCLVAGAGCYVAAFLGPRTWVRNFYAYTTFGFLLVELGSLLQFSGPLLVAVWCALALAATWLGELRKGNPLRLHGALYMSGAVIESGAGRVATTLVVAANYGLALWLRRRESVPPAWTARIAPAILAALLCWGVAGFATGWIGTALISALAISLAWFGRRFDLRELIWVLYPWMVFGAAKLFWQDFPNGRPFTLFLSLFFYGGTLIALPRLLRRGANRIGESP